jgi:hypothetical protein
MNTKPNSNTIALTCIVLGVLITAYIFAASRLDPGLRMAALVASTSIGSTLLAIASTMLTGRDLTPKGTHSDPADLPPGGVQTDTTVVQVPPVTTPIIVPASNMPEGS